MFTEHLGNEYEIASIFRPNAPLAIVAGDLEKLGNELPNDIKLFYWEAQETVWV